MTEDANNLTLILLRRLDEKVDRLIDDVRELKGRTAAVEENLAGVHRRIDRMELRLDRIERRLDLADATH